MSRSGYSEECDDNWARIMYRGAVASAMRGARGQKLLKETLVALDEMPVKELVEGELEANGQYCTLGALGKKRGFALSNIDPEDSDAVAKAFDISPALVKEIVFENDEGCYYNSRESPKDRWQRMRAWVANKIIGDL